MRVGDTEIEEWRRSSELNDTKMELQLQQSIANQEASLTKLRTMISGNTESVSEFFSRYKPLQASKIV